MAKFDPSTIVLTGASGGIGTALALEYATPGRHLVLIARDPHRLDMLAENVRRKGAEAETAALDIRDRAALHAFLAEADARRPVDLLIANAGVTAGLGAGRSREPDDASDRQFEINFRGTVNTITGLVEQMRARRRGHIALVASLAGLRALPDMPSYSASKAAVISYGHSLRGWLAADGVGVTILCPGFVTSPMSARHKGAKPFEITAEDAARRMRRAIERQRSLHAFPFLLATGIRLQGILPPRLSDYFMKPFAAEIEDDPRFRD
ncbi:SDR family NAD(P)-dependent oxidoreductase [Polymorphum gilvum]|uniref:Putative oxidoreductase n=1 Tax=Polymorphum gilvum (strain LMG 25793 / CGMCC 1.9160 / SL003B-26A1) TaxID=991905 RepID=F2J5V7_POLGS|nr:SDR family NAD(P)-dependent oxidoreductase [Polymorphum gilvum]ADZ71211.1 Putative oxidoreductase [Polymorphum gilvum SL003B-26A1]